MLVIDFETKDPYISRKMGSGWVYGIVNPKSDFKVLGASIAELETVIEDTYTGLPTYYTDPVKILDKAMSSVTWIMHNAQYDLGCLMYLVCFLFRACCLTVAHRTFPGS